jgi:PTH1 family peptidyl-tRNA hydrolase
MFALIGLGNPGDKYSITRHNIGYLAVNEIIHSFESLEAKNKYGGQLWPGKVGSNKVIAFKSNDYMNDSGIAVSKLVSFYKLNPENIYVIHDDLELDFGKVRIKFAGTTAGHNGLKSIDSCIGKNYNRVRVGIDHPGSRQLVNRHVLGNFKKKELEIVDQLKISISSHLKLLISKNKSQFLNNIKL